MMKAKHKGDFSQTEKFFEKAAKADYTSVLDQLAAEGVAALSSATPVDAGKTANSWSYEIVTEEGKTCIYWLNSNVNEGVNIAVILQYGHGTGTGGYVQGRDYINPAMAPIFDRIADEAWKEVVGK